MIEDLHSAKYVISTSLKPSRRMRTFGRDLAHALINGLYITRGKKGVLDLKGLALSLKASRLIMIQAKKGNPGRLDFYDATSRDVPLLGSLLISGAKLLREQKHSTKAPSKAKLVVHYEVEGAPLEMRRTMMLIPTLFDLEVNATGGERWFMKISWTGKSLEVSFIDKETALSFGPVIKVRNVVLPTI